MSRPAIVTMAALVLIVGVVSAASSRSRTDARQVPLPDTCATIAARTQTATAAATLTPSMRPSFGPPQFDTSGNLILPTFAVAPLGAVCINGVMIRDESGNVQLPPQPSSTVGRNPTPQTEPGTPVGLSIRVTPPLSYDTTTSRPDPLATTGPWGMNCSVRPWDSDCGSPMETQAQLATTIESRLSHEPTPAP